MPPTAGDYCTSLTQQYSCSPSLQSFHTKAGIKLWSFDHYEK